MPEMERTPRSSRCLLPWILLIVILLALIGTAWWGYSQRETVTEYAVAAMLEQQLGEMLPPGEDPVKVAVRVSAVLQAVKNGQIDPERLEGMGQMFREYYADRHLDPMEFESLLAFAENAVQR